MLSGLGLANWLTLHYPYGASGLIFSYFGFPTVTRLL